MVVGQDVAVGRDDDTGSERALLAAAARHSGHSRHAVALAELVTEEAAQEVIILPFELRRLHPGLAFGADRHHRGGDDVDDVGVGIASAGNRVSNRSRDGRQFRGRMLVGGDAVPRSSGDEKQRSDARHSGAGRSLAERET
ncbi:MAG: hypothetical protein AUF76_17350 [Acidobacteria bacterium 13_1_20CM_2_65_9]|nr:MAG: hypothetical protein AUF76_17350 [Acidobacteria bacterium 13_1_20CM_2_65_9]